MKDKREHISTQTYTQMSIPALFTITEMWIYLKFLLNIRFINTVNKCSYAAEYSPIMKQNNIQYK